MTKARWVLILLLLPAELRAAHRRHHTPAPVPTAQSTDTQTDTQRDRMNRWWNLSGHQEYLMMKWWRQTNDHQSRD